jgi:hypothetical protein
MTSGVLKKKQNTIAYHRGGDAIAAKIMRFGYIKSEENVRDILTKPISSDRFHHLVKKWLFQVRSEKYFRIFRRFKMYKKN